MNGNLSRPLTLGSVPYTVGAPLLAGLESNPGLELVRALPSRLIEDLRRGRLEGALVSSIEAFRRPGYFAARDLGIAATGPVRSVRLFLRTDPSEVRTLAADLASETSVVLARILLARRFGAGPITLSRIDATLRPSDIDADAVLLIGDKGASAEAGGRRILDLGEAWHEWRGLPFVFALWLFRTEEPRARAAIAHLMEAWRRGRREGILDGVGGRIEHRLEPRHHRGLEDFARLAAESGLCGGEIRPTWLAAETSAATPPS